MADTRLYSEFADKKNYEQLSTGIIKILWYSLKDFILAMQRTECLYFIQKWNIKKPPFTNHQLISTNKFFQNSIISQMSQLYRIILTQITTLHIRGVRRISQHYGKNYYTREANELLIGTGIFIFVIVTCIFSPNLNFSMTSRHNSIDK